MKYCIFDLDGTILDTITTITYYVNETLKLVGLPPISEDEGKIFAGNGAYKLIERTLGKYGITDEAEIQRVLKIYKDMYDKEPLYHTRVFDGIKDVLLRLKDEGHKLGVVSNKPDTAAVPIVEHFFPGIFDCVSGALDGVPVKPAPDLPLRILLKMGGTPEECAFVGDTYVDMETGVNLGAKMKVGVLWGFRSREELEASGASVIAENASRLYEVLHD